MAKMVFRLNHVPDAEADAVRELLHEHQLEFYETHEGRWGLSVAAIWLKQDEDFAQARQLIDAFQAQHQQDMRAQHATEKAEGRALTVWKIIRHRPILFFSYWALIIAILALAMVPMYQFFNA